MTSPVTSTPTQGGEAGVRPVRLQISRKKGFDLQAHSRAVNGLPAVNCARPSRWGNPHDWRAWRENFPPDVLQMEGPAFRDQWCREQAVEAFRTDIKQRPPAELQLLRGRNLVCWCDPRSACHTDVLLRLANGINCDDPLPTGAVADGGRG